MRHRSLVWQLVLGAVVVLLILVAVPVVWVAARQGIEAVRDGDGATAVERALVALLVPIVPVAALAAYGHWLSVTARPRPQHPERIPSRAEEWILGGLVLAVVAAGWPVLRFLYDAAAPALAEGRFVVGVPLSLLGLAYLAFAAFCITRYVQWMRG
jgi:hypothetical protein